MSLGNWVLDASRYSCSLARKNQILKNWIHLVRIGKIRCVTYFFLFTTFSFFGCNAILSCSSTASIHLTFRSAILSMRLSENIAKPLRYVPEHFTDITMINCKRFFFCRCVMLWTISFSLQFKQIFHMYTQYCCQYDGRWVDNYTSTNSSVYATRSSACITKNGTDCEVLSEKWCFIVGYCMPSTSKYEYVKLWQHSWNFFQFKFQMRKFIVSASGWWAF